MPSFANLTFLLIALLCAAATSVATSIGTWPGKYLAITMTLRDSAGVADVKVSLLQGNTGWYAFGIGNSMTTSKIIVMWINPDGSSTVSLRNSSPHVMPLPSSNQSLITNVTSSSGTIQFTMPLSSSDYSLSDQSKYFIWAYSAQTPLEKVPTADIARHNAFGTFSLSFVTYVPTTSPPTSVSTSTGGNPGPSSVSVPGQGSGSSDDGSGSSSLPFDTLVIIHGTLGFAAWAVFAPLSVFIARFGRHLSKWFQLHAGFHVFGVALLTIAVFIIGYFQSAGVHFITPHQIIGLTMFIAMFLQIFFGGLIHHLYNPARTHTPVSDHLHRFFGFSLLLLGFAQILLGLRDYNASITVQVAFCCFIGAWVLLFGFLSFSFWRRKVHNLALIDDANPEDDASNKRRSSRGSGRRVSGEKNPE